VTLQNLVGLSGALVLWAIALAALVHSWDLEIDRSHSVGLEPTGGPAIHRIGVWEVVRRHGVAWSAFFVALFAVMATGDFTIWFSLGLAFVLALVYGTNWLLRGTGDDHNGGRLSVVDERKYSAPSSVWYWSLAVCEWFAYLAAMAFLGRLIVNFFGF
jgi:hypothetical protein